MLDADSHSAHATPCAPRRARTLGAERRARRPRAAAARSRSATSRRPVAFDLAQAAAEGAARDRDRARRRDPRSRRACARRGSRAAATSTSSSTAGRSSARSWRGRGRAGAAPGQGHRRAHQHQPEQGRPHRPPAQRRPRRRPRARAAAPRPRRSRCRTTSTTRASRSPTSWPGCIHLQGVDDRSRPRATAVRETPASRRRRQPEGLRVPLLGPLRRGRPHLRGAARDEGLARRGPARDRGRRQRDRARSRPPSSRPSSRRTSRRWAGSASRTTCCRARATSSTSTSGPARSRCSRTSGAIHLETEGKHAGCWVLRLSESEEFAGHGGARQDPRPLERHRHVHGQGHRLPALEVRPPRRSTSTTTRFTPRLELGRGPRGGDPGRRARAPALAHGAHRRRRRTRPPFGRGHARLQRHRRAPVLPAEGRARGPARPRPHRARRTRSIHFSYEIVALSPKAARELAERFGEEYRLSAEDEKKPFVEMSGRKGLGVKADDLVELLLERSRAEIGSRRGGDGGATARRRPSGRPRDRDRRAALLPAEGRAQQGHRLRLRRGPQLRGRHRARTSSTRSCGPTTSSASSRRRASPHEASAEAPGRRASGTTTSGRIALDAASTPDVAERAVETLELATLARHAFGLAQSFNHFYHRQPILQEPDAADPEPPAGDRAYFPAGDVAPARAARDSGAGRM